MKNPLLRFDRFSVQYFKTIHVFGERHCLYLHYCPYLWKHKGDKIN